MLIVQRPAPTRDPAARQPAGWRAPSSCPTAGACAASGAPAPPPRARSAAPVCGWPPSPPRQAPRAHDGTPTAAPGPPRPKPGLRCSSTPRRSTTGAVDTPGSGCSLRSTTRTAPIRSTVCRPRRGSHLPTRSTTTQRQRPPRPSRQTVSTEPGDVHTSQWRCCARLDFGTRGSVRAVDRRAACLRGLAGVGGFLNAREPSRLLDRRREGSLDHRRAAGRVHQHDQASDTITPSGSSPSSARVASRSRRVAIWNSAASTAAATDSHGESPAWRHDVSSAQRTLA
jgi:hypothetical protein